MGERDRAPDQLRPKSAFADVIGVAGAAGAAGAGVTAGAGGGAETTVRVADSAGGRAW